MVDSARQARVWAAGAVAAAVAVRVPWVAGPARPDEAGYLLVAAGARPGGPYLYGSLWVDRPPLLVAVFTLADALGGLVALRLLAMLAVAVLVVAAAVAGWRLGGARGSRWAATVAAALSVTPLLGSRAVDGEMLAAPLVMTACAVGLTALQPSRALDPESRLPDRRTAVTMAAAGAAGSAAMLVKQNFADALAFLVVLLAASLVRRDTPPRRGLALLCALVVGAAVPVVAAVAWAASWGTGPMGLWQTLFAFRSVSLQVVASQSLTAPTRRAVELAVVAVTTGLVGVLAVFLLANVRRLARVDPVAVAITAMVAAAVPAIALGGSYWTHYLVELVPAASLACGALAGRARLARRAAVAALTIVVVSALGVSTAVTVAASTTPAPGVGPPAESTTRPPAGSTAAGSSVGCAPDSAAAAVVSGWLGERARTGDSFVTVYGGADTVLGSGLSPAYPYLWSLPVRTLDPDLTALTAAVTGPHAATWVVQTLPLHSWGLDPQHRLQDALGQGYRPVASVCGLRVLLRNGLDRPQPNPWTGPRSPGRVVPAARPRQPRR